MKKVEQIIFDLGSESGNKISITDNLLLVINGHKTNIRIKDLFSHFYQTENYVKGYSVFSDKNIFENKIQLSESVFISFSNKNTDEDIFISKKRIPIIQMADLDIDEENSLKIINDEWQKIKAEQTINEPTEPLEEEIVTEVTATEIKIKPIAEEKPAEITTKEQLDGVEVKETEEEIKSEKKQPKTSGQFDEDKKDLIKQGYKEYKNGKYVLLYKDEESPSKVILIVSDKVYQKVKTQKIEKVDNSIIVELKSGIEGQKEEKLEFAL